MKKSKMKISNIEINLEKAARGGYNVVVPVFPEIKAHGETLKQAKALAREAVDLQLEALKANQDTAINIERLIEEEQHYMINNNRVMM